MKCPKCNKELEGDLQYCPYCGATLFNDTNNAPPKSNAIVFAILSLILAIPINFVAFIFACISIFGGIKDKNNKYPLTGLYAGVIAFIVSTAVLIFSVTYLFFNGETWEQTIIKKAIGTERYEQFLNMDYDDINSLLIIKSPSPESTKSSKDKEEKKVSDTIDNDNYSVTFNSDVFRPVDNKDTKNLNLVTKDSNANNGKIYINGICSLDSKSFDFRKDYDRTLLYDDLYMKYNDLFRNTDFSIVNSKFNFSKLNEESNNIYISNIGYELNGSSGKIYFVIDIKKNILVSYVSYSDNVNHDKIFNADILELISSVEYKDSIKQTNKMDEIINIPDIYFYSYSKEDISKFEPKFPKDYLVNDSMTFTLPDNFNADNPVDKTDAVVKTFSYYNDNCIFKAIAGKKGSSDIYGYDTTSIEAYCKDNYKGIKISDTINYSKFEWNHITTIPYTIDDNEYYSEIFYYISKADGKVVILDFNIKCSISDEKLLTLNNSIDYIINSVEIKESSITKAK